MRQKEATFSKILTKIGDGENLTPEETAIIESRFVTKKYTDEHLPGAIRLFTRNHDIDTYNHDSIQGEDVIDYVADKYSGYSNNGQLASARCKVNKMKPDETGNLPYIFRLKIGRTYVIRANIDVGDGLINGAIGTLCYVERDADEKIKRLVIV